MHNLKSLHTTPGSFLSPSVRALFYIPDELGPTFTLPELLTEHGTLDWKTWNTSNMIGAGNTIDEKFLKKRTTTWVEEIDQNKYMENIRLLQRAALFVKSHCKRCSWSLPVFSHNFRIN
eukprot:TRINITY_DN9196_c0_g1_i4.p1 TRINITY_DN9196_c0_g1~~TRINITY_DN9196_c0_g1_i4.p1  ORF type:complete len:119 (-),score=6.78 TRINITY_DN9196_c0_g1_i4:313-669(-)